MSDALNTLRKAGITLEADGDNLVARPRAALTDELRGLIRGNKGGLMAELQSDDGIEEIRQAFGIEGPKAAPPKPAQIVGRLARICDDGHFPADEAWAVAVVAMDENETWRSHRGEGNEKSD